MAKDTSKGVPPVTPKSQNVQNLEYGQRADTGGDPFSRMRGNYAKNPPVREEDPFSPFDNF